MENVKYHKLLYLAIFAATFMIYGNSINNGYSLDDELVTVTDPEHPEQSQQRIINGIRGIPEIFTSHYSMRFKSNYAYRPVVLTTFAIEYQFFGSNPHTSHFISVLIYAMICILVFMVLSRILFNYHLILPLLITGLFIAHPLHTEVVDNIKSRDELLGLLFALLALSSYMKYADKGKLSNVIIGMLFFLLALLSKLSAITFIAIVPLTLYFFKNSGWKKILIPAFSMILMVGGMYIIKQSLVSVPGERVYWFFENPLFFTEGFFQRIPSAIYSLGYYLRLLVFPYPLSFYYGYDYIPVTGWFDTGSLFSTIVYFTLGITSIAVGVFALIRLPKRDILTYGILLCLAAIAGFTNLFVPVVGIIGERFAFIASLGFCVVAACLLLRFFRIPINKETKIIKYKPAFLLMLVLIFGLYSMQTILRNFQWKDHLTLYRHDIKHLGKSAKAHTLLAGTIFTQLYKTPSGAVKNKLVNEAIGHYNKGLSIYPDYTIALSNLGTIYFTFLKKYDRALSYYQRAVKLDTGYVEAYYNMAFSYEKLGDMTNAILYFNKTLELEPQYHLAYIRLNSIYEKQGKYDEAIAVNHKAIENSLHAEAFYVNLGNIYSLKKDTISAVKYFEHAVKLNPNNHHLCEHIANIYYLIGDSAKAENYMDKARFLKN